MNSNHFKSMYRDWLKKNIDEAKSPRRRELLQKGLTYGTVDLLRTIWHPAIGNFNHLYPEWEVRDLSGRETLHICLISNTYPTS